MSEIICPLLSIKSGPAVNTPCLQNGCAWWDENVDKKLERCAIVTLSKNVNLVAMFTSNTESHVEDIPKAIREYGS